MRGEAVVSRRTGRYCCRANGGWDVGRLAATDGLSASMRATASGSAVHRKAFAADVQRGREDLALARGGAVTTKKTRRLAELDPRGWPETMGHLHSVGRRVHDHTLSPRSWDAGKVPLVSWTFSKPCDHDHR